MRYWFFTVVCFLIVGSAYSQYNNGLWYFNKAKLNFNQIQPDFSPTKIPMGNDAQYVITDTLNRLVLLATSRGYIYNKEEKVMKGSKKTFAKPISLVNGFSWPGHKDSIVLFFSPVDSGVSDIPYFAYSVVDLKQDSGRGAVVQGLKKIHRMANSVLTIIPHANGSDYWVLHAPDSATLFAYLFSSNGLDTLPVVSKGFFNTYAYFGLPNTSLYETLAVPITRTWDNRQVIVTGIVKTVHPTAMALIYDFDNASGKVSNPQTLLKHTDVPFSDYSSTKSEISMNDSLIYFGITCCTNSCYTKGNSGYLYQVNRFSKKKTLIASNFVVNGGNAGYWATTMAPDGRIYIKDYSKSSGTQCSKFWRINNPDREGTKCNYRPWSTDSFNCNVIHYFFPSTFTRYRPGYFVSSTFGNPCGDTTAFVIKLSTAYKKLKILFGDGDSISKYGSFSGDIALRHYYSSSGTYTVTLISTDSSSGSSKWYTDNITVYKPPTSFSYTTTHHPSCAGDTVQLRIRAANANRFTANWGLLKSAGIYYDTIANGVKDSVTFRFFYPRSVARAPIVLSAQNTNCSVNKSDTLLLKPLPLPGAHLHLVQDTLCAGSALHVADST
ncbi:MAG: hypothetical protein JNL57_10340, partial [Bacteroidetes bacterium]|nr:hypothetical protein [Bacteroidota bacterium]